MWRERRKSALNCPLRNTGAEEDRAWRNPGRFPVFGNLCALTSRKTWQGRGGIRIDLELRTLPHVFQVRDATKVLQCRRSIVNGPKNKMHPKLSMTCLFTWGRRTLCFRTCSARRTKLSRADGVFIETRGLKITTHRLSIRRNTATLR